MPAPVEVCHAENTGSLSTLTAVTGVNIQAGDLLVCVVYTQAVSSFGITSISDGTNSLAEDVHEESSVAVELYIWSKANAAAVASGATVTVTLTNATAFACFTLYRYPGGASAATDVSASAGGASATASSGNTANVAGTAAELLFGAFAAQEVNGTFAAGNYSITTAGITALTTRGIGNGVATSLGCVPGYQELTSPAGAFVLAGTDAQAVRSSAAVVVYKNITSAAPTIGVPVPSMPALPSLPGVR